MRSTFSLDDALLAKAKKLSGLNDNAPLVREALNALIQRESARRLAALGGSDRTANAPRRRRLAEK